MNEKMTDEELEQFRRVAAGDVAASEFECREWLVHADAHIAALAAERDEARRIHAANVEAGVELAKEFNRTGGVGHEVDGVFIRARALLGEVAALRERANALEADVDEQRRMVVAVRSYESAEKEWRERAVKHAGEAESHLAAMRQRAWDTEAMAEAVRRRVGLHDAPTAVVEAVARYILGNEAPAHSEMDGLEGEMVEAPECGTCGEAMDEHRDGRRADVCPTRNEPYPEPTTAEAFATVRRERFSPRGRKEADGFESALSLLERRMGAMASVLRAASGVVMERDLPTLRAQALASLTDAPPVFTLEEVERAARHVAAGAMTEEEIADLLTTLRR